MLTYLKRPAPGDPVTAVGSYSPDTWVIALAPSSQDLDAVSAVLGARRDLLQDALDQAEFPRAQEDQGIAYVYLRVPYGDGDSLATIPALFALGPDFLLTVCTERIPLLERFYGGYVPFNTLWRSQLFLRLVTEVVAAYQHAINAMGRSLRYKISNFGEIDNEDILNLVASEGVLNDFIGALVPMHATLHAVTSGRLMKMYDEDKNLIEDVQLSMGQVLEAARSQLTTARNFREAYSAMLNNSLNRVVKLLTAATVVLMFPTSVFSFYGMNVRLPFAQHPFAWLMIAVGTTALTVLVSVVFIRKRWW